MNETQRTKTEAPPERCPFCQSLKILATAKTVTESTYWRCEGCGEMWNPARSVVGRFRRRTW